jgi:hypothetical protein
VALHRTRLRCDKIPVLLPRDGTEP